MKHTIKINVDYPYPPQRVWEALTDSRALADWLMPNDFKPVVGHKFQFKAATPQKHWRGIVDCEILEIDEPRKLSYTWIGDLNDPTTVVTWTLEPTATGTRLRLEHAGYRGISGWFHKLILGAGWKRMLRKGLVKVLERQAVEL